MPGEWSEGELLIAPEPQEDGREVIRAALRQAAAGRGRPGERTAWWREGIRANLRPELSPGR